MEITLISLNLLAQLEILLGITFSYKAGGTCIEYQFTQSMFFLPTENTLQLREIWNVHVV